MTSEALNLTILVYKDQFNKKTKLNGNFIFIPKIKKDGIKTIRLIHSGDINIGCHFEILERKERFYHNKSKINCE
jgi:hypothetical protein